MGLEGLTANYIVKPILSNNEETTCRIPLNICPSLSLFHRLSIKLNVNSNPFHVRHSQDGVGVASAILQENVAWLGSCVHDVLGELCPISAQVRRVSRMFSRVDIASAASRHANLSISKTLRPQCPRVNFRGRIRHKSKLLKLVGSSISLIPCGPSCFFQQISNSIFHLVIIPLTRMLPSNCSLRIDQRLPRPVLISVELPRNVLAVNSNGVSNPKPLHRTGNVLREFFELELRGMNPNQDERISRVFLVQHFHVG